MLSKMGLIETMKSMFVHPLVAGPLAGGIVMILAYLDAKYREVEREKSTYYKLFIVSSLVFATIVYFISKEHNEDEFLNQNYDTSVPMMLPKKKDRFLKDQPDMAGPDVMKMMENLPNMNVDSKVSMKIKKHK